MTVDVGGRTLRSFYEGEGIVRRQLELPDVGTVDASMAWSVGTDRSPTIWDGRALTWSNILSRFTVDLGNGTRLTLLSWPQDPRYISLTWFGLPTSSASAGSASVRLPADSLVDDRALELLALMLRESASLASYAVMTEAPVLDAAVNDSEPVRLRESGRSAPYSPRWTLHARPRDRVRLTVRPIGRRLDVTTRGIDLDGSASAFAGHVVWIGDAEAIVDGTGVAGIDLALEDVRAVSVATPHWRQVSKSFRGALLLRFGRTTEASLETGVIELDNTGSVVERLLSDLEAAYDPDFDRWRLRAGDRYGARLPRAPTVAAIDGLDLTRHPNLRMLREELSSPPRWTNEVFGHRLRSAAGVKPIADRIVATVTDARAPLWAPMRDDYDEGAFNWHSPRLAFAATLVWRDSPEHRASLQLERVFEHWLAVMRDDPDPGRRDQVVMGIPGGGLYRIVPDTTVESRAYAIAALHMAARLLGERRLETARDAQLERMRELVESTESARTIGAYGQVCLFVGELACAEETRKWIVAAVSRDGGEAGPFAHYEAASLVDRFALLAVMRGVAVMFEPMDLGR